MLLCYAVNVTFMYESGHYLYHHHCNQPPKLLDPVQKNKL